jgi:hypothetical protein
MGVNLPHLTGYSPASLPSCMPWSYQTARLKWGRKSASKTVLSKGGMKMPYGIFIFVDKMAGLPQNT